MKSKIQKWGNSLAIRIPKSFALQTEISQDSIINLSVVEGKIIVEPEKKQIRFMLDEMLQNITDENKHDEINFGGPAGQELF